MRNPGRQVSGFLAASKGASTRSGIFLLCWCFLGICVTIVLSVNYSAVETWNTEPSKTPMAVWELSLADLRAIFCIDVVVWVNFGNCSRIIVNV